MFATIRQVGGVGVVVLMFALALPQALGQGGTVKVGAGTTIGGGLAGGATGSPGVSGLSVTGTGANPKTGPGQPPLTPLQKLLTSPYGGPVATMTSQAYIPPPPSNYPYYPGAYILPDPYGGYLKGAAEVINSQGQYLTAVQQAYLMREDVKKAQLANRRAALEQWLWERHNMPTLEDERQKVQQEQLRRAQNDPPVTEIWSGEALNVLLKNVQTLSSKKISIPHIPLDEEILSRINLNSGKAGVNFGLLKNEGKLNWPVALRELQPGGESKAMRDQLQTLAEQAVDQAKKGQVDSGTIRVMEETLDRMQRLFVKNVNDMPFAQYTEGKRYINQLYDGIKALREPNATDFALGRVRLKGNSVADLVEYMTRNGLQFAPAVGGEENAYVALHRALAAFNAAAATQLATDR